MATILTSLVVNSDLSPEDEELNEFLKDLWMLLEKHSGKSFDESLILRTGFDTPSITKVFQYFHHINIDQ